MVKNEISRWNFRVYQTDGTAYTGLTNSDFTYTAYLDGVEVPGVAAQMEVSVVSDNLYELNLDDTGSPLLVDGLYFLSVAVTASDSEPDPCFEVEDYAQDTVLDDMAADVTSILADTAEMQTDQANGGRLDLIWDAILSDTNNLWTDLTNGGRLDLLFDAIITHLEEIKGLSWTNENLTTIDSLIDTLVSRLTSARAVYLDKLNVTGTLAHSDDADTYKATGLEITQGDIDDIVAGILAGDVARQSTLVSSHASGTVLLQGAVSQGDTIRIIKGTTNSLTFLVGAVWDTYLEGNHSFYLTVKNKYRDTTALISKIHASIDAANRTVTVNLTSDECNVDVNRTLRWQLQAEITDSTDDTKVPLEGKIIIGPLLR